MAQKMCNCVMWTPRGKIQVMLTLRRNLVAEINSPWSAEEPNFNKSLVAIYWQGLFMYLGYLEEHRTDLLASRTMPCLFPLSESTIIRSSWFHLLTYGQRPLGLSSDPSNQNCSTMTNHIMLHNADQSGLLGLN